MTKDEAKALVEAHYPSWNVVKVIVNKDGGSFTVDVERIEDDKKRKLLVRNGQTNWITL
jgi:hypothetical protein